jgi:hypothetical protein
MSSNNMRLRRLRWVGHATNAKDERIPKIAFKGYLEGRRPVGRQRGTWIDAVGRNAKRTLKRKNCRRSAEDSDFWRRRIEETRALLGLCA